MALKKKSLTKRQMVSSIAKAAGMTHKKTQEVIQLFLDSIAQALVENTRLEFRDFGTFQPVLRQEKQGRHLSKNESLIIPAHKTVKFTPGKKLSEQLNK